MSQKHVELLIGRLLTDEDLRDAFTRAPFETLADYLQQGWDLSRGEIDAFIQTDLGFWTAAAAQLPSRLRRSSLQSELKAATGSRQPSS
jgi:hypothetical protein